MGGDVVNWHNSTELQTIQNGGRAIDLDNSGFCYGGGKSTLSETISTTAGVSYELAFYTGPINFADPCSGTPTRTVQVTADGG